MGKGGRQPAVFGACCKLQARMSIEIGILLGRVLGGTETKISTIEISAWF